MIFRHKFSQAAIFTLNGRRRKCNAGQYETDNKQEIQLLRSNRNFEEVKSGPVKPGPVKPESDKPGPVIPEPVKPWTDTDNGDNDQSGTVGEYREDE